MRNSKCERKRGGKCVAGEIEVSSPQQPGASGTFWPVHLHVLAPAGMPMCVRGRDKRAGGWRK
eukprot:167446-Chlamydomonas_euryale.AAC.1